MPVGRERLEIDPNIKIEQRALSLGKWGNLFMGCCGVFAAWLSNSQALLVDGLFSLVGFTAAVVGAKVSLSSRLPPDERRPIGYAADESLFVTFRALSLLGLLAFASLNAIFTIVNYAKGGAVDELRYGVILIYFALIGTICGLLAFNHYRAWKHTGATSHVLRLEAKAALFDGLLTLAAGAGLSVMPFLESTRFGWVTPIGDAIIVLLLCLLVAGRYYKDFKKGIEELAGVTADTEHVSVASRIAKSVIEGMSGHLIDLSVLRSGRTFQVQVYYDPGSPVSAFFIDDLTRKLDAVLTPALGPTVAVVIVSQFGRLLEPSPDPSESDTGADSS